MNKTRAAYLTSALILLVLSACEEVLTEKHDVMPAKYVSLPFSFGEVMQTQAADGLCPIRISFGSECCGIDQALRHRFDLWLAKDVRVANVYTQSWGREGEVDYCLAVPVLEDREPVLREMQNLLNTYGEPRRGYVHILRSG